MRGVFRAHGTISGVTTAKTLLMVITPADKVIEILSARISAQDEDTSEQMFAELNRIASFGSETATTITPKPTEEGSSASACTVKLNVTATEPTYDNSNSAIHSGGANKLAGWEYTPMPEERGVVKGSDAVGLRLIDALSVSTDLTAEIIYREIG